MAVGAAEATNISVVSANEASEMGTVARQPHADSVILDAAD